VLDVTSAVTDNPIILYDGVCGLCNRLVQFVLKRDHADRFRFAPLQSKLAAEILLRHGVSPGNLDTFYVVQQANQADERLLARSDAVGHVLSHLGSFWRAAGYIFGQLPKIVQNAIYDLVARHRYGMFGRSDTCPLPNAKDRAKFLDIT
jgi:predicted DCC family thiol-disulfide oxidoreductase YuxK